MDQTLLFSEQRPQLLTDPVHTQTPRHLTLLIQNNLKNTL